MKALEKLHHTTPGMPQKFSNDFLRPLMQPITFFGLALICLIWASIVQITQSQRQMIEQDSRQSVENLGLVVAQNSERTASELDRILKYIRDVYKRGGYSPDWSDLIQDGFTVDNETVQIAVTDAKGMMITSTAMLHPPSPVDLSDREHFQVQLHSTSDSLFISKPVLGRASGKWSVQFTRRYLTADGRFGGIIIISLDPEHFAKGYSGLRLGTENGIALVGTDNIVRSGSGRYANYLGRRLPSLGTSEKLPDGIVLAQKSSDKLEFSAIKNVHDYPLKVVVTSDESSRLSAWKQTQLLYFLGAALASLLVGIATIASAFSRHRFEKRIIYLARFDQLTNLPNRFHLGEIIDRSFEDPKIQGTFAICIIDLDSFKSINDTYGHPIGDCLLIAAANRLRSSLRSSDFVARLGGDEFAIVLRYNDEDDITALLTRVGENLKKPFALGQMTVTIAASMGVAFAIKDATNTADLLRVADLALYAAKGNTRGAFCFFSESMSEKARARRLLETDLMVALDRDEFEVFYQPIISMLTGKTTGYEALLRWRHPTRGLVSPLDFIPVAEETGLIVSIGEWVLRKACKDLADCSSDLSVSVNCSPVQLKSDSLVASVKHALEKSGLDPHRLRLELTESMLMDDQSETLVKLRELQNLGIRISLDDFGTGYSCLGYLQRYPIDCIKIDRSFVMRLQTAEESKPVIQAIIAMASSLRMTTVAEGVETEDQLNELKLLGCTEAQGYLLGRPQPAADALPRARVRKIAA